MGTERPSDGRAHVDGLRFDPMSHLEPLWTTFVGVRRLGTLGRLALVVILVLDLVVIGGNLIYLTVDEPGREATHPIFSDQLWNGDVDNSWMERAGHLQLIGAAIACVVLASRHRQPIHLVTAALLAWIAIDDSARMHERGGELFLELGVGRVGEIAPQALGELAVWALAGSVMVVAYLVAWRSANPLARRRTVAVLTAFPTLLFFALVVDLADHVFAPYTNSWFETGMALLENCGELAAVTLITVVVLVQVSGCDVPAVEPDPAAERSAAG